MTGLLRKERLETMEMVIFGMKGHNLTNPDRDAGLRIK